MANKFQIKRTTVSGRTPNTSDPANTSYIDLGELAVNLPDKKLFTSNGSAYFEIGSNLSSLSVTGNTTISSLVANSTPGNDGQVLYSNGSTIYWDDIPTSTLTSIDNVPIGNTIPSTGNFTNLSANDLTIGNSSVNTTITSNSITAYSMTVTGNLSIEGATFFVNSTIFQVGDNIVTLNADYSGALLPSDNVGLEVNRGSEANVYFLWNENDGKWQYSTNSTNFSNLISTDDVLLIASNASIINTGTLTTAVLPATINTATVNANTNIAVGNVSINTTAIYVGNNLVGTTISGANVSIEGTLSVALSANIANTLSAGNTTVNGFINVSSTGQFGNNITVSGDANVSSNMYVGTLVSIGNTSVNTVINSSSVSTTNLSGNGASVSSVNAVALEGNTVLDLRNYFANASLLTSGTLDTARLPATVNVADVIHVGTTFSVNTSVLSFGNTTVNTVINTSSITTNEYYGNGFNLTSINAATLSGNTITEIFNYSSNADNISSGTLNTARLPSVVNVSTEINVGGNVGITTSIITVGNTSVNTQINSTSISTTNLSGNGVSITSVDAASVGGNTASDLRTYADNQAGNAYSNAVSAIVENAIAFSIALG